MLTRGTASPTCPPTGFEGAGGTSGAAGGTSGGAGCCSGVSARALPVQSSVTANAVAHAATMWVDGIRFGEWSILEVLVGLKARLLAEPSRWVRVPPLANQS